MLIKFVLSNQRVEKIGNKDPISNLEKVNQLPIKMDQIQLEELRLRWGAQLANSPISNVSSPISNVCMTYMGIIEVMALRRHPAL